MSGVTTRPTPARPRRFRGDGGSGMAAGLVLLFTLTAAGAIWLARDVDRAISNRAIAQSIAFQAARSGAQRVDLPRLRLDGTVVLDEPAARGEGAAVATRLLGAAGVSGWVASIDVEHDRITVVVEVTDGGRTVTGVGSARASDGRADGGADGG